jgi:hypothetical protein
MAERRIFGEALIFVAVKAKATERIISVERKVHCHANDYASAGP